MRLPTKFEIPAGSREVRCRGCDAPIYWVKPKFRPLPVNPDGTPHWATCPNAVEFRREEKKTSS